jgi:hypothetical protein
MGGNASSIPILSTPAFLTLSHETSPAAHTFDANITAMTIINPTVNTLFFISNSPSRLFLRTALFKHKQG